MSEFLQNLLKKVKDNADALEAPPAEPGLASGTTFDVRSKQRKKPKPGLRKKPGSGGSSEDEPSLPLKPGVVPVPGLVSGPSLAPASDLPAEPGSGGSSEDEPSLPLKPGLPAEPLPFQLLRTFTHSKAAITNLIPDMKDSELRLYHYLAELTYGNPRHLTDHVITYSQKQAMKAASIKSTATIVKSMNSLCKKKLVKWIRKARKRGEVSQIKVFLPGDFQEPRTSSDLSMVQ
ncbi:MAG: hypothetical protein ACLQPD_28200 [Desulfomonilaceae bacterium]